MTKRAPPLPVSENIVIGRGMRHFLLCPYRGCSSKSGDALDWTPTPVVKIKLED